MDDFKKWADATKIFYTDKKLATDNIKRFLDSLPDEFRRHVQGCESCIEEANTFIHNTSVNTWIFTKKMIDHSGLLNEP